MREKEVEMLYFIASGGVPMLLSILVNDNTYAIRKGAVCSITHSRVLQKVRGKMRLKHGFILEPKNKKKKSS